MVIMYRGNMPGVVDRYAQLMKSRDYLVFLSRRNGKVVHVKALRSSEFRFVYAEQAARDRVDSFIHGLIGNLVIAVQLSCEAAQGFGCVRNKWITTENDGARMFAVGV